MHFHLYIPIGGTVDIASHVLDGSDQVREIATPTGGPWGGKQVDQNLIDLFDSIFGKDFMTKYQEQSPKEWLDMQTHFETLKKGFKPDGSSHISIPVRYNFGELCDDQHDKSVKKVIKENAHKGVTFNNGEIVINPQKSSALFEPVISKIVSHLRQHLRKPEMKKLDFIFLVGGFSECLVLQQEIKKAFGGNGLKILTPSSAQLAVVKGAVLYGHQPREIKSRRARFTYGSAVSERFDAKIHDPAYKRVDARGFARCDDIFRVYITQGDEITVGEKKSFSVNAPVDSAVEYISLLRLDGKPAKPVQYINAPGIRDLGQIQLATPTSSSKRDINLTLDVGCTEINVSAVFVATGRKSDMKYPLL